MSETDDAYDGTRMFESFEELKSFVEVSSDADFADWLMGATYIEGDITVDRDGDVPVLILGTIGTGLEFPLTLDQFWDVVSSMDEEYELQTDPDDD